MKTKKARLLSLFLTVLMMVQIMPATWGEALAHDVSGAQGVPGVDGLLRDGSGSGTTSSEVKTIRLEWNMLNAEDIPEDAVTVTVLKGNDAVGTVNLTQATGWTGTVIVPDASVSLASYTYVLNPDVTDDNYGGGKPFSMLVSTYDNVNTVKLTLTNEWSERDARIIWQPDGIWTGSDTITGTISWTGGNTGSSTVEFTKDDATGQWTGKADVPNISGQFTFSLDLGDKQSEFDVFGYADNTANELIFYVTQSRSAEEEDGQMIVVKEWINTPAKYQSELLVDVVFVTGEVGKDPLTGIYPVNGIVIPKPGDYSNVQQVIVNYPTSVFQNLEGTSSWLKVHSPTITNERINGIYGDMIITLGQDTILDEDGNIIGIKLYNTVERDIVARKKWVTQENEYLDYESLDIVLYRNGVEYARRTMTPSGGADNWGEVIFENVQMGDVNGAYTFEIREENIVSKSGTQRTIDTSVSGPAEDIDPRKLIYTVTNTIELGDDRKETLKIRKTWDGGTDGDAEALFMITSENLTYPMFVSLYKKDADANGVQVYEIPDMPIYKPGTDELLHYDVQEIGVPAGYVSTLTWSSDYEWHFLNQYETKHLTGRKVWQDAVEDIGDRPNITLYLQRALPDTNGNYSNYQDVLDENGVPVSVTLDTADYINAENKFTFAWPFEVQRYDQYGSEYDYRLREEMEGDNGTYLKNENGMTVTNTKDGGTGFQIIELHKVWDLNGQRYDGSDFPALTLRLYHENQMEADGSKPTENATALYTWEIPAGTARTLTMYLPDSVVQQMNSNTTYYLVETPSSGDGVLGKLWAAENGGVSVIDWTPGEGNPTATITNKLTGNWGEPEQRYIQLRVTKKWDVEMSDDATLTKEEYISRLKAVFNITQNGKPYQLVGEDFNDANANAAITDAEYGEFTITGDGYVIIKVPVYDTTDPKNFTEYVYDVTEEYIDGFDTVVEKWFNSYFRFTNRQKVSNITFTKTWDMTKHPLGHNNIASIADLNLQLIRTWVIEGTQHDEVMQPDPIMTIPVGSFAQIQDKIWEASIDIGKYPSSGIKDGVQVEYTYRLKESFTPPTDADNYHADPADGIAVVGENGHASIRNVYDADLQTKKLYVEKRWVNIAEAYMPSSITVQLRWPLTNELNPAEWTFDKVEGVDGYYYMEHTISGAATEAIWSESFDVPIRDIYGNEIQYTVEEVAINGIPVVGNRVTIAYGEGENQENVTFVYSNLSMGDYYRLYNRMMKEPSLRDTIKVIGHKRWDIKDHPRNPGETYEAYHARLLEMPGFEDLRVQFVLLQDGNSTPIAVSPDITSDKAISHLTDWQYEFEVPLYRVDNDGNLVENNYTLGEVDPPAGFDASLSQYMDTSNYPTSVQGWILNASTEKMQTVEAYKLWDWTETGLDDTMLDQIEKVVVRLQRANSTVYYELVLTADDWYGSTDIVYADANNNLYTYSVTESIYLSATDENGQQIVLTANKGDFTFTLEGEYIEIASGEPNGVIDFTGTSFQLNGNTAEKASLKLTNKLSNETSIRIRKIWASGMAIPNTIKVRIYQDNVFYAEEEIVIDRSVASKDYTISDLPKYNPATGALYEYTVKEVVEAGFGVPDITEKTDTNGKYTEIVNKPAYQSLTGIKHWIDGNVDDVYRPTQLTVYLRRYLEGDENNKETYKDQQGNDLAFIISATDATDTDGTGIEEGMSFGIWTFELLDGEAAFETHGVDADGDVLPYVYEIFEKAETRPQGYEIIIGSAIANDSTKWLANKVELVDLSVEKAWNDQDNRFGTRPVSVTVVLERRLGTGTYQTVTGYDNIVLAASEDADENWKAAVNNLPKYGKGADGKPVEYEYRFRELNQVSGYQATALAVVVDGNGYAKITNNLQIVTLYGRKEWDDVKNVHSTRPTEGLTVVVERAFEGTDTWTAIPGYPATYTVPKPATNDTALYWDWELKGLPKAGLYNGTLTNYQYRFVETAANVPVGYEVVGTNVETTGGDTWGWGLASTTSSATAQVIKNKLLLTDILTGQKQWLDDGNEYGVRPTQLKVTLARYTTDPDDYEPVTGYLDAVTGDDEAEYWTFATKAGLPRYEPGTGAEYTYIFLEEDGNVPAGYACTTNRIDAGAEGEALVNRLTEVVITGAKTWDDFDNQYDTRPDTLTVQLQRSLSADDWTNAETIPVNANLEYDPDNGSDDIVISMNTGTDSGDNTTAWGITNLPMQQEGTNARYYYRFVELAANVPAGYEVTGHTLADGNGYAIANSSEALSNKLFPIQLSGAKDWLDNNNALLTRPDTLYVTLQVSEDGTAWQDASDYWNDTAGSYTDMTIDVADVTVDPATGNWTWTLDTLWVPQYVKGTTTPLQYQWIEAREPAGYSNTTETALANSEEALVNELIPIELTGRKNWVDFGDANSTRPDTLKVALQWSMDGGKTYADVPGYDEIEIDRAEAELADPDSDTWEWTLGLELMLPEFVPGTANPIVYQFVEKDAFIPTGYACDTAAMEANSEDAIENSLKGATITGRKLWQDGDNVYSTRPDQLTVQLERSLDDETYTPVAGYQDIVVGGENETRITASKGKNEWTWSINAQLPQNGELEGVETAYIYRFVEKITDIPLGYAFGSQLLDGAGHMVATANTNEALINKMITVPQGELGWKRWVDDGNAKLTRPSELYVTMEYSADGVTYVPVPGALRIKVTGDMQADTWSFDLFDEDIDFPMYVPHTTTEYIYRFVEADADVPSGYRVTTQAFLHTDAEDDRVLVNELQTVKLASQKQWLDGENEFETRPKTLIIQLQRAAGEGEDFIPVTGYESISVTGDENSEYWDITITEALPKYVPNVKPETEYIYRFVELTSNVPVGYKLTDGTNKDADGNGYATANEEGEVIANELITIPVTGRKTWIDNGDERPDTLLVTLERAEGVGAPFATFDTDYIDYEVKQEDLDTDANGVWTWTLPVNLPKYVPGSSPATEYIYRFVETVPQAGLLAYKPVQETALANHATDSLINELDSINIEVTKIWSENGMSILRPSELKIILMGFEAGDPATDPATALYTYERTIDVSDRTVNLFSAPFDKIPRLDGKGQPIHYVVAEAEVRTGDLAPYTIRNIGIVPTTGENRKVAINNGIETTSLTGFKTWNDTGYEEHRPEYITVYLWSRYTDDKGEIQEQQVRDGNGNPVSAEAAYHRNPALSWNWTFDGLDAVDVATGKPLEYFVKEDFGGYLNYISSEGANSIDLVNDLKMISLIVGKNWEGETEAIEDTLRPDSLWVTIKSLNDPDFAPIVTSIDGPDWNEVTVTLPMYTSDGKTLAQYEVIEEEGNVIPFYTKTVGSEEVTVTEDEDEYSVSFVNTFGSGTIKVIKDWRNEGKTGDALRPDAIRITLTMDQDDTYVRTMDLPNALGKWEDSFTDLTKYAPNGSPATYTITEALDAQGNSIPYYTAESDTLQVTMDEDKAEYEATFVNSLDTVDIDVSKDWQKEGEIGNALRPLSILITLTMEQDDTFTETLWLTSQNDWADGFTGLPKYAPDGTLATYTLTERRSQTVQEIPFYLNVTGPVTVQVVEAEDQYEAAFQNDLKTITIDVEKDWQGEGNYGNTLRPSAILVTLKMTNDPAGAFTRTLTLPNQGAWKGQFPALPMYNSAGELAVYGLTESRDATTQDILHYVKTKGTATVAVAEGTTAYAAQLVNTLEPYAIKVVKRWSEPEGASTAMRQPVTVTLTSSLPGFAPQTKTLRPNTTPAWTDTFQGLRKYDDAGNLVTYTLTESDIPGYQPQEKTIEFTVYAAESEHEVTFTNALNTRNIRVEKVWLGDQNNLHQMRPDSIELTLVRKPANDDTALAEAVGSITLPHNGNWYYDFVNLDEAGAEGVYAYTVIETPVDGYDSEVDYAAAGSGLIKVNNTLRTVDISGRKTWADSDDKYGTRPSSIDIVLERRTAKDAADTWTQVSAMNVGANSASPWTWQFTGWPETDQDNNAYTYRVREVNTSKAYTSSYTGGSLYDLTNELITLNINVTKNWVEANGSASLRPTAGRLRVTITGDTSTGYHREDTLWVSGQASAATWSGTITGLPKYDRAGSLIAYTINEKAADIPVGYTFRSNLTVQPVATEALVDYAASVTNELITTSITVEKNWDNLLGRSYSVEVRLLADNVVVDRVTFNSTNTAQRHTFENLPVYDASGNRISYTVSEVNGEAFGATIVLSSTEANTYIITNTAPNPTSTPVVTPAPTPTATTQPGTGGGGGGGSGSTAAPTPTATVTATPTATATATPTTPPTNVPRTGPTATPRPMPQIPQDTSGRAVNNVQSYYDIDDMDTPLGAGDNMNLGDCFD